MNNYEIKLYAAALVFFCWMISGCGNSDIDVLPEQEIENQIDMRVDLGVEMGRLREDLEFLTTIRPYRNYQNVESLNKVASYIEEQYLIAGLGVKRQPFMVEGKKYQNVIGILAPEKNKRLVVGAHYDVAGDQVGADDNASAIAGLLELARILKPFEKQLTFRVDFVAYTLEEPPFFGTDKMGSYVHAKSLVDGDVDVVGMVCLEMIGYFSDEPDSQSYPVPAMSLIYPDTGNFIAVVSNTESAKFAKKFGVRMNEGGVDVQYLSAPSSLAGVDFSDHRNYWKFDIPALMVTDTAFYRNPNYHQQTDTIETIDFEKMSEVVKGVGLSLRYFGKTD